MPQILTVDTTGFTAMARDLSKISGAPIETVLLSRTASVLSRCIEWTPKAKRGAVERQVNFRNRSLWDNGDPKRPKQRGHQIVYVTKKGTQWFADEPGQYSGKAKGRTMGGKTFHDMNSFFHWSDERWARWQARLGEMQAKAINVSMALKSVGVAASSWYQCAKQLGIASMVKAPQYVKNATPQNGKVYINGKGHVFRSPEVFYVEVSNNNPSVVGRMGGANILARAIQANIKGFYDDVARGVFNDIKTRAQRYKGVFVT